MNHITLGDLQTGLNDLFTNRLVDLRKSRIAQLYEDELLARRAEINALPIELTSAPRPLTERIDLADDEHDGAIRVLWYITQAALEDPLASPDLKAAAKKIREQLGLSLSDTRQKASDEIQIARGRAARVEELKPELTRFPLPGDRTLYDAARAYLAAAEELNTLLSERASLEAMSEEDRSRVRSLRPEIVGLFGRLRRAMGDEIRQNPELPRNLDAQVFGYFDELERIRAEAYEHVRAAKARAKAAARAEAAVAAQFKAAAVEVEAGLAAKAAEEARERAEAARADAQKKAGEAEAEGRR
jgi:hypothetical protein